MAPGLTNNPAVSAILLTTTASFIAKFTFRSQFASYPLYAVFLQFLPLVILAQAAYHIFLYSRFLSPLKHLPLPKDVRLVRMIFVRYNF